MSLELKKARTKLVLNHPFFGCLLLNCKMQPDESVESAATDGQDIFYNEAYLTKLKHEEIMGLLAHQVGHKMFMHTSRLQNREVKIWEMATDYVINGILKAEGMILPAGFLHNTDYADMSAEEVYKKLKEETDNQQKKDSGSAGDAESEGRDQALSKATGGGAVPNHLKEEKSRTQAEQTELEGQIKSQIAQAAQMAKQAGKLPASIAGMITAILAPKVSWRKQLRDFVTETAKSDYTFRRPNRRMMAHDLYMPSLTGDEMPPLALIFDTSGSIYGDQKTLNTFISEINSIIADCRPMSVVVAYADTRVVHHQELEQGEELVPELKGGGGTAFGPAIRWIDEYEEEFAGIIYFTDLYASDFGFSDTPTMWAVYDNKNAKQSDVPFGRVILIED